MMRLRFAVSMLLLTAAPLLAQDLRVLDPGHLPEPLGAPLKLLATTAMSGEGCDWFTLKPRQTAVVGTVKGPALIVRIWSTSSKSANVNLAVTVDGTKRTLYQQGKLPAGVSNSELRALDLQAYWSYVPVPVGKQAVFTATSTEPVEEIKFYLQVGYKPATPELLKRVKPAMFQQLDLARQMQDPLWALDKGTRQSGTVTARQPWEVPVTQPVTVQGLVVRLPEAVTMEQVNATRLTVTCDGSRTIDTPLGALFGQFWQLEEYVSAGTATRGRDLILRFPMPVQSSLSISTGRLARRPLTELQIDLYTLPASEPPQYHLCAQYFSQVSVKGEPLKLLDVKGPGFYIGSNLAVDGLDRKTFAFLEGNEQIFVDGAPKPTIEGTGTEDYFNGAWYFEAGQVRHPFHGVIYKQDKEPPRVVAYRYMIPDLVPFKSSFRFDLQHGSRNGAPDVWYRGVAFWYQQGQVNVAEPAEPKLPESTMAPKPPDSGWVRPSAMGALVLVVFVARAAFLMMHRRRRK